MQVVILWAVQNGKFDDVDVEKVKDCQDKMTDFFTTRKDDILAKIRQEKKVTDEIKGLLESAMSEFKQSYK